MPEKGRRVVVAVNLVSGELKSWTAERTDVIPAATSSLPSGESTVTFCRRELNQYLWLVLPTHLIIFEVPRDEGSMCLHKTKSETRVVRE